MCIHTHITRFAAPYVPGATSTMQSWRHVLTSPDNSSIQGRTCRGCPTFAFRFCLTHRCGNVALVSSLSFLRAHVGWLWRIGCAAPVRSEAVKISPVSPYAAVKVITALQITLAFHRGNSAKGISSGSNVCGYPFLAAAVILHAVRMGEDQVSRSIYCSSNGACARMSAIGPIRGVFARFDGIFQEKRK